MDDKTAKRMALLGMAIFFLLALVGAWMRDGLFMFSGVIFFGMIWIAAFR